MIYASDIGRKISAAVRAKNLEIGIAIQHAVKDQPMQRDSGVERIADDIVEIVLVKSLPLRKPGRVKKDQRLQFLRPGPNRLQPRRRDFFAVDPGENQKPPQTELAHAPLHFGDRQLGFL